jgi:hypothetical protein
MRFHITTQVKENYGTAEIPYWKFKGGDEYIVEVDGFNFDGDMAFKKGEMIIDQIRDKIEFSGPMFEEFIIGWGFVPDDFQTSFERDQLEFDGEIMHPAKRVTIEQLMEADNVNAC